MRNHIQAVLLLLVLAALVCDIAIHSRPVHAQGPATVYIDTVPHRRGILHEELTPKGTQIVGFQCADGNCYVLSK